MHFFTFRGKDEGYTCLGKTHMALHSNLNMWPRCTFDWHEACVSIVCIRFFPFTFTEDRIKKEGCRELSFFKKYLPVLLFLK